MRLAYWFFVMPAIILGWFGPQIMLAVGAATKFPAPELWWCMAWAYFAERFGAMHLNTYALANKIIAHVANSGAGIVCCIVATAGWPSLGLLAVPMGILIGNAGFYGWYCARLSYTLLGISPYQSEMKLVIPPAIALLAATLADLWSR